MTTLAGSSARAHALCRARRFDQAERLLAADLPDTADASLLRARLCQLAGRPDEARAHAARALATAPGPLRAHLLAARLALRSDDQAAAITHLERATSLRPDAASLRARLADLLRQAGELDRAMESARAALDRDPLCHSASLVVARCHLARGNTTHAKLALARIARDRPGWSELAPFLDPPAPTPPPNTQTAAQPLPPASLLDHASVLRAVMLRGLAIKHAGNPLWLPLELVRPTVIIAAHWLVFAVLNKPMPGQIPIPLFVLAGFSVWFAFNYAATGAANGAKYPLAATPWPGVSSLHLRLARAVWPLLVNLCFCLLAVLPLRLYRPDLMLPDIVLTVLVFAVAGAGGIGYGLLAERLAAVLPALGVVEKLLNWALFVTCGLYFTVYGAGPIAGRLLLLNPLLHLIEFERHAFDAGYPLTLVDFSYPVRVAAIVLTLGLAAVVSVRRAR